MKIVISDEKGTAGNDNHHLSHFTPLPKTARNSHRDKSHYPATRLSTSDASKNTPVQPIRASKHMRSPSNPVDCFNTFNSELRKLSSLKISSTPTRASKSNSLQVLESDQQQQQNTQEKHNHLILMNTTTDILDYPILKGNQHQHQQSSFKEIYLKTLNYKTDHHNHHHNITPTTTSTPCKTNTLKTNNPHLHGTYNKQKLRQPPPPSPLSLSVTTADDDFEFEFDKNNKDKYDQKSRKYDQMTVSTINNKNHSNININVYKNAFDNSPAGSYELKLLKSLPMFSKLLFPLLAEISISPVVSTTSSDFASTRRFSFAVEAAYCNESPNLNSDNIHANSSSNNNYTATSMGFATIDLDQSDRIYSQNFLKFPTPPHRHNIAVTKKMMSFSRSCLVQIILRNPQDSIVSDIFIIKLDLSDMPPESRTIIRQKSYKSTNVSSTSTSTTTSTNPEDLKLTYLSKAIEIPLIRTYDSDSQRQKIRLTGPIHVAFSFNRSNLRYTSVKRGENGKSSGVETVQKTTTVIQFPSASQKYFPLNDSPRNPVSRADSLTDETIRSFQHGSLCL